MIDRAALPEATSSRSKTSLSWQREAAIVLSTLVVVISLFYYEVIFLGRTFVPIHLLGVMGTTAISYGFTGPIRPDNFRVDLGATGWAMEPWTRKVASEYSSGRFPLWNENQGFGAPLMANAESGGMDLLRLPVLISNSPLAWDLYFLTRTLFGAMFTYLFARSVGLALAARLFLAIAYAFSGHFMILGNNTWIGAYFLLPVILLGTEMATTSRTRMGFGLTAVAVALSIHVGMPEVTLFVMLLGAAYGGFRLLGLAFHLQQPRQWIRRAALLIGAWVVGILLAAPLLLTLFEFVAHSSARATERGAYGLLYEQLRNFSVLFMPYLNGPPLGPRWLALNLVMYVGTTVLVLALYGIYPTRTTVFRRVVPFAGLAAFLLLAKMFGVPIINELGGLPGLNVTLIQKWSAPVAGFFLALLASVAVHRLVTDKERSIPTAPVLVVFFWLTLIGLFLNWDKVTHAPVEHMWRNVGGTIFFATIAGGIVHFRRRVPSALTGLALCALVTFELFVYAPRNIYQERYDRFTEPPYVRFLKDNQAKEPFRIFALDGIMFPNTSSVFGIDDIRALDALYIDRYLAYIRNFVAPGATDRYVGFLPESRERATLLIDNPWLDLAGVRYVLTRPDATGSSPLRGGIVDDIIAADAVPGRPARVRGEGVTIDGISKPALVQPAPMSLRYPVKLTQNRTVLHFSPTLKPEVWDPPKGDGVAFEVAIEVDGKPQRIYRREVDPKNDKSQRSWVDDSVDLSKYAGRDLVLILSTDPLKTAENDIAAWGDIRFAASSASATGQNTSEIAEQYAKAYGAEVQIFENLRAFPRTFLVSNVIQVADMNAAISVMKQGGIDPRNTAVVEGSPAAQVTALSIGTGSARISSRNSTDLVIDVEAGGPSFLVLTDSYYPGWQATVDGSEVPIYATDLAFQGIFVPEGRHRVEFHYRPMSFTLGLAIAFVGLLALVVVSTGFDPRRFWLRRQRQVIGD